MLDPNNVATDQRDPVPNLHATAPPQLPAEINSHGHKHTARPVTSGWPRKARLTVTLLIVILASAATASGLGWRQTSARLTVANAAASHQAVSQRSVIAGLQRQVSALQSQLAIISQLGICFTSYTNNSTGMISGVSLSAPGAGDKCVNGQFISVVPPQGAVSRGDGTGDGS